MRQEISERGAIQVVKPLEKSVDVSAASDLKDAVATLIDAKKNLIILDMTEVEFVDSTGLGAMVYTLKRATAKGGDAVLVGLQPGVRSLLETTRLDNCFQIYDDESTAVAAMTPS